MDACRSAGGAIDSVRRSAGLEGTYSGATQIPLRAEAAAWKGRLVSFEIFGPWREGRDIPPANQSSLGRLMSNVVVPLLLGSALLVALANLRSGRGDLHGATRLAVLLAIASVVADANIAHHPTRNTQYQDIVALALFRAAQGWVLYMAIEPYVRRHWPQALIAWSRALAGRFRDPVVCGHVLVGMAAGFAIGNLRTAIRWFSGGPFESNPVSSDANRIGAWAADLAIMLLGSLVLCFAFVLLRLLLRHTWMAGVVVVAAIAGLALSADFSVWPSVYLPLFVLAGIVLGFAVAMRLGLLALAGTMMITGALTGRYPITADFSVRYASQGLLQIGFILVIALWCFHHALAGRRLLKPDLLD